MQCDGANSTVLYSSSSNSVDSVDNATTRADKNSLLQALPRFKQIVTQPTHGNKTIDVIIMNCADLYAVPQVATPVLPDDPHQAPSRPTGRCRSQLSGSSRPGYTRRSGENLHCTAPLLDK